MRFTLSLCFAKANGWVLLFWWEQSFKFLGDFLLINLRFFRWGLLVVGFGFSVLGNCFLY